MTKLEQTIRRTRLCRLPPSVVRIVLAMTVALYIMGRGAAVLTQDQLRMLLGLPSRALYRSARIGVAEGVLRLLGDGSYTLTPLAVEAIKEVFLLLKGLDR